MNFYAKNAKLITAVVLGFVLFVVLLRYKGPDANQDETAPVPKTYGYYGNDKLVKLGGEKSADVAIVIDAPRDGSKEEAVVSSISNWITCFESAIEGWDPKKFWIGFETAVKKCTQNTKMSNIEATELKNLDEQKYVIYGSRNITKTIVTLGIGTDVTVETTLKKVFAPESQFYGADPTFTPNAALFKPIGEYFPFAISARSGVTNASIRSDDGNYVPKKMHHIGMSTFLREMVNASLIDVLLIDNEGAEYEILPLFYSGGELDDIVVCQMNVEFHIPGNPDWTRQFANIIRQLVKDHRYIPVLGINGGHQRVYLINVYSRYCIREYLEQFF